MIDIQKRLLVVFQAEAKEHLARMRSILGAEGERTAGASLDEVFRRAHSLKGAARAVDLRLVESLAHPLETLLARVRGGGLRLEPRVLAVIHQALDAIDDGVAAQLSGKPQAEPLELLAAIHSFADSRPPSVRPPSAKNPLTAAGLSAHPAVPAPAAPVPPPAAPAAPERPAMPAAHFDDAETMRVNASIVERLHLSTEQLVTESLSQNLLAEKLAVLGQQVGEIAHEWALVRKTSASTLRRMAQTPELARLGRYLSFVERQVAAVTKDTRELALFQRRSAWSLRNIGAQLQEDICGARMTVAEAVFDHFGKMLRELSRNEGKEIEFRASGLEVEADRLVLQALKDPLMHLLRNTLAHGIEAPAERKLAGKPAAGVISLRLQTLGNKLQLTVEDDGRGVDLDRVTEAAVSRHLLTAAAAAALTPEERRMLIFHPGISTSRAVTELAGRGMGLSVVAEAVSQLQGHVEVHPGAVSGTQFIVTVPLALSSNRLLLVKCRGQRFALMAHALEHLQRIKIKDIVTVDGRPCIDFQGALLPLTSLAHLLKFAHDDVQVEREMLPVAVLKSGDKRVAVAVDAFISEFEGVIKALSPLVLKAGKLSGATLMGDGSVVLVLNAAELVEAALKMEDRPVLKTDAPVLPKREPTILVVDDSMTTRTLEKSILEAHGYRVLVAVDGVEALSQLRGAQVDLIVSDVEMPRLDGFGLLQELKKDPALAKIPLILVTSLEKREDKERGLALGADGYLVKRKFDQKILLDTVAQIL